MIGFSGGGSSKYVLQMSAPPGSSTFPAAAGHALVSLYDANDSNKQWAAGVTNPVPARGSGTLTINTGNTGGNLNVEMTFAATKGTPSPPIHVTGTWTC